MNNYTIRPRTVKLIGRLIKPLVDEGIILVSEEKEILSNLKHLVNKGTLAPTIEPRLVDMRQAAIMLGLGMSNFKKLEKDGAFPFNRRMIGSSVRYRNTDVIDYILSND